MAYQFHGTAHIEKRAGERGFNVEEAMLTINEHVSIIKTPVRRGNHGGFIWLFSRAFGSKVLLAVAEVKGMSAGSSPDIGKSNVKSFIIAITRPPIVEIDTEATAAYIRLREGKVARTKPHKSKKGLVMLDFDAKDNVIGIEVMGQQEFSIRELIKQLPIRASDSVLNQTRYVSADLQPA